MGTVHHFCIGRQIKGHMHVLLRITNYKEAPLQKQPTAFSKEQGNVSHSSESMEEPEEGNGEALEKENAEGHRAGWGIRARMRHNREKYSNFTGSHYKINWIKKDLHWHQLSRGVMVKAA